MAKANPVNLNPQPPEVSSGGPVIEYVGEEARKVQFTMNPAAARYVVQSNGIVTEYMQ